MAAVAAPASSSSGSSSSSAGGLSLTLRQRPHLGWISTGWSGLLTLPESERATIEGKVEVRVGGQPVPFLQTLKVELKKTETVLTSKGVKRYFEVRPSQLRRQLYHSIASHRSSITDVPLLSSSPHQLIGSEVSRFGGDALPWRGSRFCGGDGERAKR